MVPVQRKTRTQGRKRRSQDRVKRPTLVECPSCRAPKFPHAACRECGYVRPGLKVQLEAEED